MYMILEVILLFLYLFIEFRIDIDYIITVKRICN